MRCKFFSVLLAVCVLLVVSGDLQAENKDTIGIKIGGIVHPYGSAFLARAEYEHAFTGFVSIVPSLNYLSYDYEDDGYTEEGRGPDRAATVSARLRP